MKGVRQAREGIVRLGESTGGDGMGRCAIVLDPGIMGTKGSQRRAFKGWRYLAPEDAPPDLPEGREDETELPVELNRALAEIGVL